MIRARLLALVAFVALAACHRKDDTAGALDANADARAQTAAKTAADLAAADAASRVALPRPPAAPPERPAPTIDTKGNAADVSDPNL